MDPEKVETPVESQAPVADSPASFSDIHAALMSGQDGEKEGKQAEPVEAKAKEEPKKDAQAEPATHASGETKQAEEGSASETQTEEDEGDDKESDDPKKPILPKYQREKYRLRRQRDEWKDKAEALEAKMRELGVSEEPEAPTIDPVKQAEFKAKTAISRKNFIKTYGEDKLKELVGEDSTWIEIEERAKSGDSEAIRLHQRALDSEDPFEEIQVIVEDERIFEEYGTRSVATILAQALERQSTDLEKRLQAEHVIRQPKTGKPVKGLGSIPGKTPEAQKVEEANRPFSIREFYGVS